VWALSLIPRHSFRSPSLSVVRRIQRRKMESVMTRQTRTKRKKTNVGDMLALLIGSEIL
jgi:hypothetical protein